MKSAFESSGSSRREVSKEYLYSPLERILVHCKVTPSIKTTGTHLFTCEIVEFLAQEHNTMSRAIARTRIAGRALTMEPPCLYNRYLVYSKQLLLNSSRTLYTRFPAVFRSHVPCPIQPDSEKGWELSLRSLGMAHSCVLCDKGHSNVFG